MKAKVQIALLIVAAILVSYYTVSVMAYSMASFAKSGLSREPPTLL